MHNILTSLIMSNLLKSLKKLLYLDADRTVNNGIPDLEEQSNLGLNCLPRPLSQNLSLLQYLQEFYPQFSLCENVHPPEIAYDPEACWELDVGS